jgi:hypothetical protein
VNQGRITRAPLPPVISLTRENIFFVGDDHVVRTRDNNSALLLRLRVVAIEITPSALAISIPAMPALCQ